MNYKGFYKKVGFISLGCDKNRVDTEKIISTLSNYSCFEFVSNQDQAQIIIVNTCAFLKTARDECKQVLSEMKKLKDKHYLDKLVVAGCLPMLDLESAKRDYPFVDLFVCEKDYKQIDKKIFELYNIKDFKKDKMVSSRILTTSTNYAYLKIADGCNNMCAFCKIPYIRGRFRSFDLNEIVNEAKLLCEKSVKEIILVAQDLTSYGKDSNTNLVKLLRELGKIKKLSWIRLLYCYPEGITDELIEEIANNPKIVKYVDMPLQHISDDVLKKMNRKSTSKQICALIKKLRKKIPRIKIRSTFMVGFPGETQKDFKKLCAFLKRYKLDNVGFFKYSLEEGTSSYYLKNQIDEKTKDVRLEKIQEIQQKIADKKNKKYIGKVFKVLVDSYDSKHKFYVARPYFSCPDVDFEVLIIHSKKVGVGNFVDVKIVDYSQNYFIGEALWIYQTN